MHKAANEVDLLTALHKKLIKWKFQVQGEDLNKTHLLHYMPSIWIMSNFMKNSLQFIIQLHAKQRLYRITMNQN